MKLEIQNESEYKFFVRVFDEMSSSFLNEKEQEVLWKLEDSINEYEDKRNDQ